ncbi:hypothetical protein NPIL_350351 [Nephila pilipes]|uniref:PI3K/PI4K catalytic domain-containing protein n=1 Tax=Nephila pilipes TaxID=299642 RepID=A0A8X6KCT7_NEPPI|nr:hypothetical protein NPIL_350351 [Nephila pilipes]
MCFLISEGDLHIFLYQLSKWIAHYERKKKNNKRSFPLKMQSTFLSSFHLHHEEIQMFMNSYTKPTCIQISRFLPIVEVMESNDGSAYRIFIEGSNGKVYPYIIIRNMYSENVLQEDRIFQFFSLLNSLMTIERPLYSHSLQFKIPAYVCIHPCLKMIQCDVSSYSLLDIYNQYCTEMEQQNLVIPALLEIFCALNQNKAHIPNTGIDKSYRIKIFNTIQENMVPKTIIKKKFANGSAINYMESRKKFAVDIALAGISRFLFFLNQQMPEETFINFGSGEVSTFGLKFSLLHDVDTQDTYIPFRLTKNISEFITPMGVSGYVKSTILHTVQCFNKHDDEIESFLKTLLLDEFDDLEMNIYGCSNHKKNIQDYPVNHTKY